MAEEAWKVPVQQRLVLATGYCARAHRLLTDVLGDLAAPILVVVADAAPALRSWAQRAEGKLVGAFDDLAVAASLMSTALPIALRGAAADPEAGPLLSPDDAPTEALRTSLARLTDARDLTARAFGIVAVCRANLCGARRLLDHPHLPRLLLLLNASRASAHRDLVDALKDEQEGTALLSDALAYLLL